MMCSLMARISEDGMANNKNKNFWLILFGVILINALVWKFLFKKDTPINIQPIEVMPIDEHLKAIDSMNRYVINALYFKIDSLNEEKQKVIVKTKILYKRIGIDSTLTSDVLYNHTLLDDTSVSYPFNQMVQFRLIQGLEYRGLHNLSKVENNVLKTIIDTKNDIIEHDSVLIVKLHSQNVFLSDSLYKCNMQGAMLEIDNHRLKGNNKKLWVAVGGLLVLLGLK